jgi:hypothetical protein
LEELETRLEKEVVSVLVLVLVLVACSADLELETAPTSELELLEMALGLEPEMVVEFCLVSVVVWLETVLLGLELGLEMAMGLDTRLGS